jgi:integrating conjugative element protein (TIGR03761 family)
MTTRNPLSLVADANTTVVDGDLATVTTEKTSRKAAASKPAKSKRPPVVLTNTVQAGDVITGAASSILGADALRLLPTRKPPKRHEPIQQLRTGAAKFPTSPSSPFPDKYDIVAQRKSLAFFEDMDDLISHPRFDEYFELEEREKALRQMKLSSAMRQHADPVIHTAEAKAGSKIGGLVPVERDLMTLHTTAAFRLFVGRDKGDTTRFGASSGRRAAAALKTIWQLTSNDNPYADWALVQLEERITTVRQRLDFVTDHKLAQLKSYEERGLHYSVMHSASPVVLELGFKSPLGFMIADLIVAFDYLARVVRTHVARDLIGSTVGKTIIYEEGTNPIRSIFESLRPIESVMRAQEMQSLSRSDWASVDTQAKARVQFALDYFGPCPNNIFTGEKAPRHTLRQSNPKGKEKSLLRQLASTQVAGATSSAGLL